MNLLKTYTLMNSFGTTVEILNYGARIKSIKYPVNGKPLEMLATHQNTAQFLDDAFYLGATCGRVANRILGLNQ